MSTTVTAIISTKKLPSLLAVKLQTGVEVRLASRKNEHTKSTSGLAPSHLQANLIILPSKYAADFRDLCARNPVPCPLIAESRCSGDFQNVKSNIPTIPGSQIAASLDLRTDCPNYNIYQNSKLVQETVPDIISQWTSDHVAFLIGCSYSFESALVRSGFHPRHALLDRNVPMYRSNIPLNPAGAFTGGTYVVSMRPYPQQEIDQIRAITRKYLHTHGECVAWGWDAVKRLGIEDIDTPQWGDAPLTMDGAALGSVFGDEDNVPLFWGCGVTPQEAVMRASLEGTVMGHAPGHVLVLNCLENDILT